MKDSTQRTIYLTLTIAFILVISIKLKQIEDKIDWLQAQQDNVIETLIERE